MIKTAIILFDPKRASKDAKANLTVLDQYPNWIEMSNGMVIYLPLNYQTKISATGKYVEAYDSDYETFDGMTLNDLLERNLIKVHRPYVTVDRDYDAKTKNFDLKTLREFFKRHGFNVTKEAIRHNYGAWCGGLKSGYRDEENGYHLFTPCGGNPLSFRLTSLHPTAADWQTTYVC